MQIYKNNDFDILIEKYQLNIKNLPIPCLSPYLKFILEDQVVQNEYGIGLSSFYIPSKDPEGYGQSYYGDSMNHFHVTDMYSNDRDAFITAIFMAFKLAEKFQKLKIHDIRIWVSFQTRDMAIEWNKDHNFHEENDEIPISDRISFFRKIPGEVVISDEFGEDTENTAILIIDIG